MRLREEPVRMKSPFALRLPFWMASRFDLALLLSHQDGLTNSQARRWLEVFALSGPETVFARGLLARKRNLWLFRCHQRRFCGDFVVIDMSASIEARTAWVLELKQGAPLRFGVGGVQLKRAPEAVTELSDVGVLGAQPISETVMGGGLAIQAWLGAC